MISILAADLALFQMTAIILRSATTKAWTIKYDYPHDDDDCIRVFLS